MLFSLVFLFIVAFIADYYSTKLKSNQRKIKRIFVSGPYSESSTSTVAENVAKAVNLSVKVAELGAMPVCPIAGLSDSRFMQVQNYSFWIDATEEILKECDGIIFVSNYLSSNGSMREEHVAVVENIPRFYSIQELEDWLEENR